MSDRGLLGERMLRPSRLGGPVQRIVFTTYAALIGLALAIVFRSWLSGTEVPTYIGYVLPQGTLWIGSIALTFAVIALLAGAVHARTRWRYLIAAPVLFAILGCMGSTPATYVSHANTRYYWMDFLVLPFLIAAIVLVAYGKRLRTRTVLWLTAALGVFLFAAIAISSWATGTLFGATAFFMVAAVASMALMPALMVVGLDLSEIGSEAGGRAVHFLESLPRLGRLTRLLLPVAGLAAAGALYFAAGYSDRIALYETAIWFGLLVLAAAAALAFMRGPDRSGAATPRINYLQALAVAIIVSVSFFAGDAFNETTPGYLVSGGALPFSLKLPNAMNIDQLTGGENTKHPSLPHFSMTTHGRSPTLAITGVPHWAPPVRWMAPRSVNDLTGITRSLPTMPLHFGKPDANGWSHSEAHSRTKRGHGVVFYTLRWEDPTYDYHLAASWYLVCGGFVEQTARVQAMCEHARRSFSTDPLMSGAYRSSRPAALILALVFLVAGAAMLLLPRLDRGRPHTTLFGFIAWALFLTALRWTAGYLFGGVEDPLEDSRIAAELFTALTALMALIALAANLWPAAWARGRDLSAIRHILDGALLSIMVVAGVFYLYVVAVGSSAESAAIRGIIIVLVLSWELAMAGSALNPSSEHHVFPRASRVFIFTGYLVLVAACVFALSGGKMNGYAIASFDTESLVANGILILGGALVVSRALQWLARLSSSPAAPQALLSAVPQSTG